MALLLLPQTLKAEEARANLMIIPGRVVMDSDDSYGSVILKNSGRARGDYNVELVDLEMLESGNVMPLPAGKPATYSARPYLHVAPRSVSLAPGEMKKLQLVLRKPQNLEPGEYRAHLKMRLVDDEADEADNKTPAADGKSISITMKARIVITIPVIFRHGETHYTMQIESPKLSRDESGAPVLDMYLHREGNRSSMGDISVEYVSPEGKSQKITFFPGVPVYREISRRAISIPLDVPSSVDLSKGSLKIIYTSPEEEKDKVQAETTLRLS